MSAEHVTEFGTAPEPEDMTRDEIIAAITAAKRPGVLYRFELYGGPACEHCGEPGYPLMRFARALPREAWIVGTPKDGSRDKLICAVQTVEPQFDPELAAAVIDTLRDIAAELNASP